MEIKHDLIEKSEKYKEIESEVNDKIIAKIGNTKYRGYNYDYWTLKKEILKNEYGIIWKSPAELNPFKRFD